MDKTALSVLVAPLLLLGCSGGGNHLQLASGEFMQVQNVETHGLPAPGPNEGLPGTRPYRVGPFDKLRIEVFGVENMNREVQADASGQISFPLIGVIEAAGKTPREIESEVTNRLRGRYIRNPQVSVNLTETVSQIVTVDGQVVQPGLYPVVGRMTLIQAIATARGTTEFARESSVLVFRRVNGQNLVGLYNLQAIRQGFYPDPEIFPNDLVVVDEARARRLFSHLLQLAPVLTAPLVAVLQSN